MELLLFLSALLSALTGVISSGPAPEIAVHRSADVTGPTSASLSARTAQARAERHFLVLGAAPRAPLFVGIAPSTDWARSSALPLYLDRLRQ